jgi:hypothetical protein
MIGIHGILEMHTEYEDDVNIVRCTRINCTPDRVLYSLSSSQQAGSCSLSSLQAVCTDTLFLRKIID